MQKKIVLFWTNYNQTADHILREPRPPKQ